MKIVTNSLTGNITIWEKAIEINNSTEATPLSWQISCTAYFDEESGTLTLLKCNLTQLMHHVVNNGNDEHNSLFEALEIFVGNTPTIALSYDEQFQTNIFKIECNTTTLFFIAGELYKNSDEAYTMIGKIVLCSRYSFRFVANFYK